MLKIENLHSNIGDKAILKGINLEKFMLLWDLMVLVKVL